jgi:hypothetical protein
MEGGVNKKKCDVSRLANIIYIIEEWDDKYFDISQSVVTVIISFFCDNIKIVMTKVLKEQLISSCLCCNVITVKTPANIWLNQSLIVMSNARFNREKKDNMTQTICI